MRYIEGKIILVELTITHETKAELEGRGREILRYCQIRQTK